MQKRAKHFRMHRHLYATDFNPILYTHVSNFNDNSIFIQSMRFVEDLGFPILVVNTNRIERQRSAGASIPMRRATE